MLLLVCDGFMLNLSIVHNRYCPWQADGLLLEPRAGTLFVPTSTYLSNQRNKPKAKPYILTP
jgi:hypothetical protein